MPAAVHKCSPGHFKKNVIYYYYNWYPIVSSLQLPYGLGRDEGQKPCVLRNTTQPSRTASLHSAHPTQKPARGNTVHLATVHCAANNLILIDFTPVVTLKIHDEKTSFGVFKTNHGGVCPDPPKISLVLPVSMNLWAGIFYTQQTEDSIREEKEQGCNH